MEEDVLFVVTRVLEADEETGEWFKIWNFNEEVAFVSNDGSYISKKKFPLVVIRGHGSYDVVSKILDLKNSRQQGYILIHLGGEPGYNNLKSRTGEPTNWCEFKNFLNSSGCTYSIGGGVTYESELGDEVKSLAQSLKERNSNGFKETLSNLFKAFNTCAGVEGIVERTKKVESEIIRNKVLWRYEYFLELSQRLLALNDENKAVVKKIVFGKDAQEYKSYEQLCTLNNERDVEVIVDNRKFTKNEYEVFEDIGKWVSTLLKDENYKDKNILNGGEEYTRLYNNIYNCLEALCRNEKEKILGKEKYSST